LALILRLCDETREGDWSIHVRASVTAGLPLRAFLPTVFPLPILTPSQFISPTPITPSQLVLQSPLPLLPVSFSLLHYSKAHQKHLQIQTSAEVHICSSVWSEQPELYHLASSVSAWPSTHSSLTKTFPYFCHQARREEDAPSLFPLHPYTTRALFFCRRCYNLIFMYAHVCSQAFDSKGSRQPRARVLA
jgi:hypothetical protein